MSETERRLARCLRAVFPDLAGDDLAQASVDTVAEWDSLHAVLLVAVLEETFDVRIPARDYPRLTSYSHLLRYLSPVAPGAVQ